MISIKVNHNLAKIIKKQNNINSFRSANIQKHRFEGFILKYRSRCSMIENYSSRQNLLDLSSIINIENFLSIYNNIS